MAQRPAQKPWHEVVSLRGDLKTDELSLAIFAADLYDVVMQRGQRPVYEDPAEFFALTYLARLSTVCSNLKRQLEDMSFSQPSPTSSFDTT